jgi:pimeloyl-ACP methyl ester carboxylesterase
MHRAVAMEPTKSDGPRTIVLIHGLWLTALSWEKWVERFSSKGHRVVAESWPGMNVGVEQLRRDPSAVANLGIAEIVEHYQEIIQGLGERPIIMGHSFGGLITQILLDHGLGSAGVAMDSAPVKGIFKLMWSELKSSFPALKNPANNHRAVALTPEEFHYAFTNTVGAEESRRAFERYAVPGPGRVLFQAVTANFNPRAATKVDFGNPDRAPLLIVAGEKDHVSPVPINETNAKLQRRSSAITAFKSFPGRPHLIIAEKGWEEVADFALDWAMNPVAT